MAKEKNVNNQYLTKGDIEKHLKSDKAFMNSMSAAEFEAYMSGAVWMMGEKQHYIDKLKDRLSKQSDKILELQQELAPYHELYEDYDFVEKRSRKSKKNTLIRSQEDEEGIMTFQDDDYSDIRGGISDEDMY